MLRCSDVAERATTYLEGDMSRLARWSMRLHLMMCRHCRQFMHQMERTRALLRMRSTTEQAAPDGLTEQRIDQIVDSVLSGSKPRG